MPANLLVKKLHRAIARGPTVKRMTLRHVIFAILFLELLDLLVSAEETAIFTFHTKGQGLPALIPHEVFAPLIEFRVPVGPVEDHPRIAISKFPFDNIFNLFIYRQHKLFGYEFKIFIKLTVVFLIGILLFVIVIFLSVVFTVFSLVLILVPIIPNTLVVFVVVILPVLVIIVVVLLVRFLVLF